MLFDEPERYFAPASNAYYQQGDVVLAPVATLEVGESTTVGSLDERPLGQAEVGEVVTRSLWAQSPSGAVGSSVAVTAAFVPAMITTHDCTLDKEFSRRVEQLRAKQMSIVDAENRAAADTSLDRYLTVAPIVPFSDAAPSAVDQLARNRVVGYFPVCDERDTGVDAGVADLLHQISIDKSLIVARIAILSADARAALRYALARFSVYRAPKLTFEVEEALGRRIVGSRVGGEGTLEIILDLDDGTELRFVQAPSGEPVSGPERPGLP